MSYNTPAWVGWTYLIYCMMVLIVIVGGTMYAVFVLGHNPLWLLGAVVIAGFSFSPWRWHSIWTGVEVPMHKVFDK